MGMNGPYEWLDGPITKDLGLQVIISVERNSKLIIKKKGIALTYFFGLTLAKYDMSR